YPNTAVIGIQVDARQFKSVPTRSYRMRGRIIRVPSNYDPATRVYVGTWDGTFKSAWSDNPAWVFYDLVLHQRYGLGHRVNAAQVDKWSLYQIGQYCDELVDDGNGGREPRFTCNCYLQSRADAYKVLQDLATIFRGMAYWANGNVVAVADMPGDPVYSFT
ncbi:host specificity protein J, partial [Pandoraea sputorum]